MKLELEGTPVLQANLRSTAKIVINQGGTSSSKTYSIIQLLFIRAVEKRRIITVTGESIPNLKKGAYRDAETIYGRSEELQKVVVSWNKTERIINFSNGSVIEFISNLDEQGAKNGKRDILFVNECNGVPWNIVWQLAIRTREQIFLDYNPSSKFYVHEKLIGTNPETNDLGATVELIISDHRHNTYLDEVQHRQIESIIDPELRRVYARGFTGRTTRLVYGNFTRVDGPPEIFDRIIWGIDYGYTNDPTAIVKIHCAGRRRYWKELSYTPGISAATIKQIMFDNGWKPEQTVYSEHDPNMINQLRILAMPVYPAIKGPGSLIAGISKVKEFENFYYDSPNLKMEHDNYKWVTAINLNTGTEVLTNVPIDADNHILDGGRFAIYSDSFKHRTIT